MLGRYANEARRYRSRYRPMVLSALDDLLRWFNNQQVCEIRRAATGVVATK